MTAVLIEHYGGKWPFWLSPRQCMIVPVKDSVNAYADEVGKKIHDAGFHVEVRRGSAMNVVVEQQQQQQQGVRQVLLVSWCRPQAHNSRSGD